jgi:hypothetical protein
MRRAMTIWTRFQSILDFKSLFVSHSRSVRCLWLSRPMSGLV